MELIIRTTVLLVAIMGLASALPSPPGECIDDNERCGEWASYGFCEDDAHTGYMLVFCKKSCKVCDSGIDGSEQTTDAPLPFTQSPATESETLPTDLLEFESNETDLFRRSEESTDSVIENAMHKSGTNEVDSQEPGMVTVELDMLFPEEEYLQMVEDDKEAGNNDRKKRKAINHYRWTDNTVYYKYGHGFNSRDKDVIEGAMEEWKKYTCIDFKQATSNTKFFIEYVNGGGCASLVGMHESQPGGRQKVILSKDCRRHGIVVHELGHAIGFYHEQSRTDRDDYITINTENILDGLEGQFTKHSAQEIDAHSVPYDYRSIMHYGPTYFSKNGEPAITTKDPKYQNKIGNRVGLSFYDIKLANIIYSCDSNCASKTCPGEGFVGKECKCWCDGTSKPGLKPIVECDGGQTTGTGSGSGSGTETGTPSVVKPSSGCKDNNKHCAYWAKHGFCSQKYIEKNCQKSCNLC